MKRQSKVEEAVEFFAESKVTLSEGAHLADLSAGEYMDLLASKRIKSKVTLEDYEQGLKTAERLLK